MFQKRNANAHLTIDEKILWLRLFLSKGIGPTKFWDILKRTNNVIGDAVRYVRDVAGTEKQAEKLLLAHDKNNFSLLTACEESFPKRLLELRDCPPVLSVVGNLALLNAEAIAIVGARNASLLGKIFAGKIAKGLGSGGVAVISGFARGIDTAAHEGSVETGTVAVFAGGVDVIYPTENAALRDAILKNNGVIVSEMMPGTTIDASLFPRRNRVIAGMSVGVVLIEAALKSGSLITAKFALELGREIFVVPGSPFDARTKGGNLLIKQGAVLIDSVEDIFEVLQSSEGSRRPHPCAVAAAKAVAIRKAEVDAAVVENVAEDAVAERTAIGEVAEAPLHGQAEASLDLFPNSSKSVFGYVDPVLECSRTSKYAPLLCSVSPSQNSDFEGFERGSLKDMILSELGTTPVPIEILFNHHNCDLPTLLAAIGELELEGRIKRNTKNEIFLATQSQKV